MKEIIAPIERGKIMAELTPERFLRHTNKGGNEIYVVNYKNAPYTMQEIGRLREIAFRSAGGGTGKEVDIDMFDTMEKPCQQLIVWDPDAKEILGGYRFILGEDMQYDKEGRPIIAISHMFDFSPKFIREYMPHTIELGRSFVSLEYQSTRSGAKGLFALDNLWDGLGALVVIYPQIKYFFGKVTMYPTFSIKGRNMILYFLNKHFADTEKLVWPRTPLETNSNYEELLYLASLAGLVNRSSPEIFLHSGQAYVKWMTEMKASGYTFTKKKPVGDNFFVPEQSERVCIGG